MASTTALPPPSSTARQRLANFIGWLFYFKACAGRIVCLLQGLCRPDRLPAVFACNGLICHALPAHLCHAMPTAHIHQPLFCAAFPRPLFIAMCARIVVQFAGTALLAATTRACTGGPCTVVCIVRPSRVLQRLPCRQPHHGTALAARALCWYPSIQSLFIVCVA